MTTIELTPSQHAILAYALEHTRGKIEWFPEGVKGGARKKVLEGLRTRELALQEDGTWCVTPAGYAALGRAEPAPVPTDPTPEPAATLGAGGAPHAEAPRPRIREHTKQAQVIALLRRPEGATVRQICEATGWQPHTVRGAFAGALKKKLGLTLVSDKVPGGDRVYHLCT